MTKDVNLPQNLNATLAIQALNAANDGVTIVDMRLPEQPLVYVNKAFEQITEYSQSEILGHNCRFLQAGLSSQKGIVEVRKALMGRKNCRVILQNVKKDGTLFWNELSLSPIKDANNIVTHYIGIQKDVTHEIEQKQKIDYLSEHDDLTDLYNYRGFFKKVNSLIQRDNQQNLLLGIGVADIDNFKQINDIHGHIFGNHVLKIFGSEMKQEFRVDDIAARFGGDEFCFAVLVKENNSSFFYDKIAKAVQATNFSLSNSLQISVSIGIAFEKAGAPIKIEHLITLADTAMYNNKMLRHSNQKKKT
ncbi:MAG: diguanylate cyclase [Tatlockia sp.]|nr:diguanylate cyclase [Tatlockia sp.]